MTTGIVSRRRQRVPVLRVRYVPLSEKVAVAGGGVPPDEVKLPFNGTVGWTSARNSRLKAIAIDPSPNPSTPLSEPT
jgi:hypothetical protein